MENFQISENLEDIKLQKYLIQKIEGFKEDIFKIEEDIKVLVDRISSENNDLDTSIENCPSFIELTAKYSFNDTDKLRNNVQEFVRKNLKNKMVSVENNLDDIIKISVFMAECFDEESFENDIEYSLYFLGKDASINIDGNNYNVITNEETFHTVILKLNQLMDLIEEFELEEITVIEDLIENSNKTINFYKYCELIREICDVLVSI